MTNTLYANKKWTCPRCNGDCRETVLRWPAIAEHGGEIRLLACVGMNCDLVFATQNGMWMGHQFDGEYVPATEHELTHGPA